MSGIPLKEFADRRRKLMRAMKGAAGVLFAGEMSSHLPIDFRPDPNFEYFTGVRKEQAAAIVFDPKNPVEGRRCVLLLRPLDPELDRWDGLREEITESLRERTGFKTIYRTNRLPILLRDAARRSGKLACLHALATHTQPISRDLAIFQRITQRLPGVTIEDMSDLPAKLRAVKSSTEVKVIQQAVDISASAYNAVLARLQPGMNEFDVQEILENTYKTNGSRGPAYPSIVGGGLNATVLHYHDNSRELADGDLVCIDSAAEFGGYSADITRTFPINGSFTDRQREIYDLVLKAELAAIRAVKPGATFHELDKAARDIIKKAGYGDYYMHGIGHNIGLETHDITPLSENGKLSEGNVITIEPGIYLPDERIGVRIEDDLLVTKTGSRNLSAKIPKKAAEIERLMKR